MMQSPGLFAQEIIGKVNLARGTISAQYPGGSVRLLAKDSEVYEKDVITTSAGAFAMVVLNDETKVSIRPDTVISMDEYSDAPNQENTSVRLFKGGMRAISGYMGKPQTGNFRVSSRLGDAQMQDGKMDARFCDSTDCLEERSSKQATRVGSSDVGGRVAQVRGQVTATNAGETRDLERGSEIGSGDTIKTGANSYAILSFRDATRATLKAESEFVIEQYAYNSATPASNNAVFGLIEGGMRTVTGAIADDNPDAFKVNTSVATIGIRGTGFDLLWLGACAGGAGNCGLLGFVWDGGITSDNDAGLFDIGFNQVARIRELTTPPEFLTTPPNFVEPRPDGVDINEDELFGDDEEVPAGLYVACYEGDCSLIDDEEEMDIAAGEMALASEDDSDFVLFEVIDLFMEEDAFLAVLEEESFDTITLFELFDDPTVAQNQFECYIR